MFPLEHEPDRPSPLPGWGTAAAEKLLATGIAALDEGTSYPLWNDSAFSDYPATPGLWAVEPHIARDGVGAKFEELLVVTADDAYWLDDHLPHAHRWAAVGYGMGSLRAALPPPARAYVRRRNSAGPATEQAILDATEVLLEEQPFSELNVEDVMAAAGLGRTAFYRYFHDLESVVVRLMGTLVEELDEVSTDWIASDDAAGQLRDSIRRFASVYRDHGRLMKAFEDAAGSNLNLSELWGETISSLIGPVEAHVQALIVEGKVEVDHPIETIRALAVLTDSYLLDVYWAHDRCRRRAADRGALPNLDPHAAARLSPPAEPSGRPTPGPPAPVARRYQPKSGTGVAYSISK